MNLTEIKQRLKTNRLHRFFCNQRLREALKNLNYLNKFSICNSVKNLNLDIDKFSNQIKTLDRQYNLLLESDY